MATLPNMGLLRLHPCPGTAADGDGLPKAKRPRTHLEDLKRLASTFYEDLRARIGEDRELKKMSNAFLAQWSDKMNAYFGNADPITLEMLEAACIQFESEVRGVVRAAMLEDQKAAKSSAEAVKKDAQANLDRGEGGVEHFQSLRNTPKQEYAGEHHPNPKRTQVDEKYPHVTPPPAAIGSNRCRVSLAGLILCKTRRSHTRSHSESVLWKQPFRLHP